MATGASVGDRVEDVEDVANVLAIGNECNMSKARGAGIRRSTRVLALVRVVGDVLIEVLVEIS